MFERPFDQHHQVLGIDRLVLKMIGAAFGGLHCGVEGGVAREHNHFRLGPLFFQDRQQVEPVAVGQLQVEQHGVWLGPFEGGLGGRRALGRNHFVTLRFEQRDHQFTHVDVVVHHHDSRFHTGLFRFSSQARVKLRNNSKKTSCSSNKRSG